jgi:hypothetical protein
MIKRIAPSLQTFNIFDQTSLEATLQGLNA